MKRGWGFYRLNPLQSEAVVFTFFPKDPGGIPRAVLILCKARRWFSLAVGPGRRGNPRVRLNPLQSEAVVFTGGCKGGKGGKGVGLNPLQSEAVVFTR